MMNTEEILPHVRLKFAVDHPLLEDCWLEGYEFASNNLPENDNPYEKDTSEYEYWCQGWWAGYFGEAPLFTEESLEDKKPTLVDKVVDIKTIRAANQPDWNKTGVKEWAGTVAKIAGAIAVTMAAIELIDIAV